MRKYLSPVFRSDFLKKIMLRVCKGQSNNAYLIFFNHDFHNCKTWKENEKCIRETCWWFDTWDASVLFFFIQNAIGVVPLYTLETDTLPLPYFSLKSIIFHTKNHACSNRTHLYFLNFNFFFHLRKAHLPTTRLYLMLFFSKCTP